MERQLGLRRKPLASAIPAQVLDRHDLGNIRHRTGLVTMLLPGNHQEEIRFYISWRRHTLVLGYPWLHHLNPHLNWETGEILDWGPDYHRSCLSPVVASWGTTAPAATPPDLKGVPEQYHNLIEVFSKAWTIVLPPHWPYDCAIDLLPGTAPPKGRLYSLSQPARKAMEEYITSYLVARLIWPPPLPQVRDFSL